MFSLLLICYSTSFSILSSGIQQPIRLVEEKYIIWQKWAISCFLAPHVIRNLLICWQLHTNYTLYSPVIYSPLNQYPQYVEFWTGYATQG